MRVTCQQCSAKYTVSEEKLRHGVVRLKCKQCRTLIVVQPDGTISSGSAMIGGAAAIQADATQDGPVRDSQSATTDADRTSMDRLSADRIGQSPATPAQDALSDTALTVPLPSLAELGLAGIAGKSAAPIPLAGSGRTANAAATSAVPLPPPPPTSGARSLGPPLPPAARESGVGMVAGEPAARLSAPPSAASVQATDFDDDDGSAPTVFNQQAPSLEAIAARTGNASSAAGAARAGGSRAPLLGTPGAPLSERVVQGARASVARVKEAPLTNRGWSILAGIVVGGIVLGAIVAPDAEGGPNTPFDETSARDALRDAVAEARRCFSRPIPALVGVIDAQFAPSGEATSVEVSGGLTHVDEHRCIEDAFNAMRVEPFNGPPVHTKKTVSLSFDR